jgi:hypothetical protein
VPSENRQCGDELIFGEPFNPHCIGQRFLSVVWRALLVSLIALTRLRHCRVGHGVSLPWHRGFGGLLGFQLYEQEVTYLHYFVMTRISDLALRRFMGAQENELFRMGIVAWFCGIGCCEYGFMRRRSRN